MEGSEGKGKRRVVNGTEWAKGGREGAEGKGGERKGWRGVGRRGE